MLRLSRKTMLALEAVLDVAYNARPDPVQSKDITRRQGIPQRYLEQVMQQLVHKGILKGVRGPRGGYTLARERRKITVSVAQGEVVYKPVSTGQAFDFVVDACILWSEKLPVACVSGFADDCDSRAPARPAGILPGNHRSATSAATILNHQQQQPPQPQSELGSFFAPVPPRPNRRGIGYQLSRIS